ncbi:dihydroxyacetone kinase subunit DhaK [Bacillus sp. FJAT-50079]|uniref:dihydroxyacetone kinase subunit DhaK n=1 Tax=Bacillus sp. FJAT-50079 TaxID=2833577 RepID=UPI001BC9E08B|nr:dihydroxyacetone kinase subunit DhaK [Bacillus sp. FJAT-50079]MBS4210282.1 dihydroxyacetone kinase subunit DhaK [Bacillus sp. FJAT-50079]
MKKILNNPNDVVDEMLDGMVVAHSDLIRRIPGTTVIVRKGSPVVGKVGIVSGGGSGHEPSHAGYVGEGMLDAAVAGEVFTSPTPDQIYEAIKEVDSGKGVLLVIKNYTGDVLNFEMAAELAEADGIKVAKVVVNDDVAVEDSTFTSGRRGIAGTVFIHKIAGALAETGASLEEVEEIAKQVIQNVKSMGMALSPCIIPAIGKPGFELSDDEMEIGIGIHGEPGIKKTKILSADQVVDILLEKVLQEEGLLGMENSAVLINGLGSTPLMELYVVAKRVAEKLHEQNIKIHSSYVGNYMTAIEMAGFSISILKLNASLTKLLEAKANTIAFKN